MHANCINECCCYVDIHVLVHNIIIIIIIIIIIRLLIGVVRNFNKDNVIRYEGCICTNMPWIYISIHHVHNSLLLTWMLAAAISEDGNIDTSDNVYRSSQHPRQ